MTTPAARPAEEGGRRWAILAVLFLARTAMGFQFQSIASTAPFLIERFGIGYAEIGTLIGLFMLPGIVLALPGGLLGKRFGDRAICAAALALMIAGGLAVAAGDTYAVAFAGRLVSGIGAVLFNLVLTKMATDWFAGREIVTAMGVILASWPFGISLGLLTQGPLAAAHGWETVMVATAALAGLALVLVGGLYRAPPGAAVAAGGTERLVLVLPRAEAAPVVAAGVLWGFFNLGLVVFFSFGPPLLVEQGRPPVEAGTLASLGLWVSIISVPLGGFVVERIGRPDLAIVVFCLAGALPLALLPTGAAPAVLCAAFGVLLGPPAGAIVALPSRVLSPENRAVGLGYFFTCFYAVMAVGPAAAGLLRDVFGTAAASILFGAALFVAGAPLLFLFRRLARR